MSGGGPGWRNSVASPGRWGYSEGMTDMRAVLTAILIVLTIANFVQGNLVIGFALTAIVITNGTLVARNRSGGRS